MSLQIAKTRRLAALEKCNSDRMLVSPADKEADLKLPEPQTTAADLIDALKKGVTTEELCVEMDWPKARLMTNLYRVAKKTGIGVERRDSQLHIVWPECADDTPVSEMDVPTGKVTNFADYVHAA